MWICVLDKVSSPQCSARFVLLHCTLKPDQKKPMKGNARHVGWAVKITAIEEDGVDTTYKLQDIDNNMTEYSFGEVNSMKMLSV